MTGTSLVASVTFVAQLQGEGGDGGLVLELTQRYNIDSQEGELTGTIRSAG